MFIATIQTALLFLLLPLMITVLSAVLIIQYRKVHKNFFIYMVLYHLTCYIFLFTTETIGKYHLVLLSGILPGFLLAVSIFGIKRKETLSMERSITLAVICVDYFIIAMQSCLYILSKWEAF